jgi:ligand-binding SRPBCC domain-containing protein
LQFSILPVSFFQIERESRASSFSTATPHGDARKSRPTKGKARVRSKLKFTAFRFSFGQLVKFCADSERKSNSIHRDTIEPMITIFLTTVIHAPRQRVFDLARSIDAHMESTAKSNERAVDGVNKGLIGLQETVTWEARHFGIKQQLKVRITEMESPTHFTDEMVSGAFKAMKHSHRFNETQDGTEMIDELTFASPLGILGRAVDAIVLKKYMLRFLTQRNAVLKKLAESDRWGEFLID